MKALVLCAGFGTRLKPWTSVLPKPLIPVAGVEPLFFILSNLNDLGVKEVFVNGHHLSEKIEDALNVFSKLLPKLKLNYIFEKEILGTGGTILKLLRDGEEFPEGLLTFNGDTLAKFNFDQFLKDKSTSLAVSKNEEYFAKYQPLWMDSKNNFIAAVKDRPRVDAVPAHNFGVHFLSAEDLKLICPGADPEAPSGLEVFEDLFTGVYSPLLSAGHPIKCKVIEFSNGDFWVNIDKREFFDHAKESILKKHFHLWSGLLKKRHPGIDAKEAMNFWPLALEAT